MCKISMCKMARAMRRSVKRVARATFLRDTSSCLRELIALAACRAVLTFTFRAGRAQQQQSTVCARPQRLITHAHRTTQPRDVCCVLSFYRTDGASKKPAQVWAKAE